MIAEPQRAGADARPSLDGPTDAVSGTVAPTLFGAVFCGGESRRMGRDKARIELRGRSLLQRAIDSLSPACASVWLACLTRASMRCLRANAPALRQSGV